MKFLIPSPKLNLMRAGRGTECKKSCAFNYFGGTSPRVPTPAFTRKHAPKLKVESITRVFSNGSTTKSKSSSKSSDYRAFLRLPNKPGRRPEQPHSYVTSLLHPQQSCRRTTASL